MALGIWVLYAVLNSRVMRGPAAPGPLAWTGLQGIGAALGALPLIPLSSVWSDTLPSPLPDFAGLNFVGWTLLLGIPGAWAATWFWVIAARRLSLALSAQLVVTESLFGLAYGFVYLGRLPTLIEGIGSALQIVGVVMAVRLFSGLTTPETAIEPATTEEAAVTGSPR